MDAVTHGSGSARITTTLGGPSSPRRQRTAKEYAVLGTGAGAGSPGTRSYAEALFDASGKKRNRNDIDGRIIRGIGDVLRVDGGAHRVFEPLYWRSFRYLQLDVETGDTP